MSALWHRIYQAWSLLQLTPFDTSTPEGRSKERYRRVLLTGLASGVAKGVGILASLISIPLTVNYLGTERYGLWMTISSVVAMLRFADLGMGNGLVNAISEAEGSEDLQAARRSVSSAFFLLLGIATLILAVFAYVYSFIPWPNVFNVSSDLAAREAGPAMAVLITIMIVNMPLGIVQRIYIGYQEGYKSHIWEIAGAVLGLGGLLLAIYLHAGLAWLILALSGGPMMALLMNGIVLFRIFRPWLIPRWSSFDFSSGLQIASTGSFFLLLQIFSLIGNRSDNIVIAQIFGASAVASYAVTQKLFTVSQISQYFIAPLWPAFGEAMARGDYSWARRTLNRSLAISLGLGVAVALPLVVFGKQIVFVLAGPNLVPSSSLLWGFFCWIFVASYGGALASYNNHGDLLKKQVLFHGAASVIVFVLKIALSYSQGIEGVIWGTVFGYSIFSLVPLTILAYRSLETGIKQQIHA